MTAALETPADALARHVIAEARRWIGTPYQHQASVLGAGCDCLGLLRGVWRTLYGDEPTAIPPYTPDWSEPSKDEILWRSATRFLIERRAVSDFQAGDVLLFRMRRAGPAKHLGLATGDASLVHAQSGRGVIEIPLSSAWRRRAVAAFGWPPQTP